MEVSYNHKNISWNCKLSPHFPHSDPYTPVFSQSKGDRALPGSVSPDPTILPSCPHNTHNCQSLVSAQLSPHFRILGLALYCLVVTQTFLLLHPLTWHDSGHERKFDIWLFTKTSLLNGPVSLLITERRQNWARRMSKWVIYAKNSAHHEEINKCWHPAAPNIQQVDIECLAKWIMHRKYKYL